MAITIAGKRSGGVKPYLTAADFPNPGKTGIIYVALDTDTEYLWDAETASYVSPGGGVSVPAASTTTAGVVKTSTNADWVAKTATDVALTPGTMLNAGVLNWLNTVPIDIGDDTTATFRNGSLALDSPEGQTVFAATGLNMGLAFAGDAASWIRLSSGNSPGFTVLGGMQWGTPFEVGGGGGALTLETTDGSLQFFSQDSYTGSTLSMSAYAGVNASYANWQTSQTPTGWFHNDSGYSGSLALAGPSAGMTFANGGAVVPINTDGGALRLANVEVLGALDILDFSSVNFSFDSYANFFDGSSAYFGSGSNLFLDTGSTANFSGTANFGGATPTAGSRTTLPAAATDLASAIALVNALRLLVGPTSSNGFGFADL